MTLKADLVQSQENNPDTRSDTDQQKSTSNPISPDAADATCEPSTATRDPSESSGHALITGDNLPACIPTGVSLFMGTDGKPYLDIQDENNAYALPVGSKAANRVLQGYAHQSGNHLRATEIKEINEELTAHAENSSDIRDVYYRCAPFQNGVEIDVGDERHTRIRVEPGKVAIIREGSKTLFHRTPAMRSLPMPADVGDVKLLNNYLNLHATHAVLLLAYLTYTLFHPKVATTSYVILVLQGDQGSGKTFLCKLIQSQIDPSVVGVQTFPTSPKDLVISAQNAHVLFYDNIRNISPAMADKLCIASTGGHLTTRQLYTDAELHVHRLHVALVLNGIHDIIGQPDLAQRCLPLHLRPMDENNRRSETELYREFQNDLPVIFRGLLDLIADILQHLPTVEVTSPERMIDFVRWLAAMEIVHGAPPGAYQTVYSDVLKEGMLDSLMESPLATAVMSFITDGNRHQWSGTPSELLHELNSLIGKRTQYSKDWPQTPSALSKRLMSLQGGLRRQGIEITLTRGKERKITITNVAAY